MEKRVKHEVHTKTYMMQEWIISKFISKSEIIEVISGKKSGQMLRD